jgi:hypothetical protein
VLRANGQSKNSRTNEVAIGLVALRGDGRSALTCREWQGTVTPKPLISFWFLYSNQSSYRGTCWLVPGSSRKILSCERAVCFVDFWRQHSAQCLSRLCIRARALFLKAFPHRAMPMTRKRCRKLAPSRPNWTRYSRRGQRSRRNRGRARRQREYIYQRFGDA